MTKLNLSRSQEWYAWINMQPPVTPVLHVVGEVTTNPNIMAFLVEAVPQGINPKILILQILTGYSFAPVKQPQSLHFSKIVTIENSYNQVQINDEDGNIITLIDIELVH